MTNATVARRYAQALYEEAVRTDAVEGTDADVALIAETLDGSRELVRLFESPVVSQAKKDAVVAALFEERLRPLTLRFLRLLIEKGREDLFPEVVRAYRALRDEQQGIVEAHARTALPLSSDEERALTAALETMTGATVRLRVTRDPELLGGLIVRVGDTVYDGSVRHQLASLRERMEHGALHLN